MLAQIEPWRLRFNPGDSESTLEAQIEPWSLRLILEAQMKPWRLRMQPRGFHGNRALRPARGV